METTLSLLNLKLIWNLLFLLQLQENLDELQLTPLAGKGAGMWLSAVINYYFFAPCFSLDFQVPSINPGDGVADELVKSN